MAPTLRSLGFKGSGQNYRKRTGDAVMVVSFQKSSGGERFYVNFGVQPMCVPTKTGTETGVEAAHNAAGSARIRLHVISENGDIPGEYSLSFTILFQRSSGRYRIRTSDIHVVSVAL